MIQIKLFLRLHSYDSRAELCHHCCYGIGRSCKQDKKPQADMSCYPQLCSSATHHPVIAFALGWKSLQLKGKQKQKTVFACIYQREERENHSTVYLKPWRHKLLQSACTQPGVPQQQPSTVLGWGSVHPHPRPRWAESTHTTGTWSLL